MEATIFDENMEMVPDTSRYFDAHDDIEIELDGMEASNHDDDVIVDDASMTGSDRPGIAEDIQEPVKDADMMDDELRHDESGHKEAEEDYQFIDDALDIDHQSYEMEDDYEEDIDAPIPGMGVMESDAPANNEPSAGVAEDYHAPRSKLVEEVETSIQAAEPSEENASSMLKEGNEEVHISPGIEQPETGVKGDDDEPEQAQNDFGHPSNREHLEPEEPDHGAQVQVEDEAPEYLDETTHEDAKETPISGRNETEDREGELSTLHNVQVLYQDSEISLFPPKENDLSETYFLEDEALAHEPIGDLLNACRVVLGDHMGTDEELYMEIECLGLHLTEATRSPISLSQIVQVYLDLSRNDGETNPGPLYVSLATQPTFTQSFTALSEAAQAGKGLSYVGKWDEYEDQIVFEEHGNTDGLQEEGQDDLTEEAEKSANQPTTPLSHTEAEYEEVNDEETYVNEGIDINTNETEEQEVPSVSAAVSKDFEVSNIEANEPELEEITKEFSDPDGSVEQEVAEQKADLEQVEEPSHEDTQEVENIQPPNEGGEPSVPDASHDTNTEHTNEVAPEPSEEFIEIDLEGFEEEAHDDEGAHEETHGDNGLVDGDSTQHSYEQAVEPSTPEPIYNSLEVDEDIFKSPTAALVDLPDEPLEGQDIGRPDEVAHLPEIHDEYQPETSIPVGQNNEDTSETLAIPAEDQSQDFNTIEDVDAATREPQMEPHTEINLESKDLEKSEDESLAGPAGLDVDWPHDAPEDPDMVELEETNQAELLDGYDLEADFVAENADETTESALPEGESNGIAQNGTALQEQSPKAAKRPRVDDEPISISNPVPVIKKHRSE